MPITSSEKMQLIWNYLIEICGKFRSTISGKYDSKKPNVIKKISGELTGGAKIKLKFYKLVEAFSG